MLLVCDVGNTRIKTGIFEEDILKEVKFHSSIQNVKEYLDDFKINEAAVSSVVPSVTSDIINLIENKFSVTPVYISKDSKFNLKIEYDTPETLGIDRICAAEGAYHLYKISDEAEFYNEKVFIIACDFGTASTINVVKYPGVFIGGTISPGLNMMFNALNEKTAQLPVTGVNDYSSFIGKSTRSSIASGVINASAGLIEKAITYLNEEYSAGKIKIYLTGGSAEIVAPYIKAEHVLRKVLCSTESNQYWLLIPKDEF